MFGLNSRQIFFLVLLAAAVFVGAQYIPAYLKAIEFNDFIASETRYAASSRKTEEKLRLSILEKAKELQIPIGVKDIRIARQGPAFTLNLDYSLPIDFQISKQDLKFHVSETGELFN